MGQEKIEALKALKIAGLPRFLASDASASVAAEATSRKHIYLIRHGQAAHNIVAKPWGEDLVDARLTDEGRQQAATTLAAAAASLPLEVIVTSPLCRAIDTAILGLAPHIDRGVAIIACEECREQFGQNLPDRRRATAALRADYPHIDFAAITEEDALFTPEREALEALVLRADAFLESLLARPEQHIAVTTHSSFLAALCNAALDTSAAPNISSWFDNAEMRVLLLERVQ